MDTKNKCHTCSREACFYSDHLKKWLCFKHVGKMLINRARSAVISRGYRNRTFKMLDDGSAASVFIAFVFKKDEKSSLTLANNTVEYFAVSVLKYFIKGIKPTSKVATATTFNPLYTISEKELDAFMAIKGFGFRKQERSSEDSYFLDLANKIEKRRPGGMISTVKLGIKMGLI